VSRLDKWKKLADEAATGPWTFDNFKDVINDSIDTRICSMDGCYDQYIERHREVNDATGEFIAASREAVPVLIESLEKALDIIHSEYCTQKHHPICEEIRAKLEEK